MGWGMWSSWWWSISGQTADFGSLSVAWVEINCMKRRCWCWFSNDKRYINSHKELKLNIVSWPVPECLYFCNFPECNLWENACTGKTCYRVESESVYFFKGDESESFCKEVSGDIKMINQEWKPFVRRVSGCLSFWLCSARELSKNGAWHTVWVIPRWNFYLRRWDNLGSTFQV